MHQKSDFGHSNSVVYVLVFNLLQCAFIRKIFFSILEVTLKSQAHSDLIWCMIKFSF